MINKIVIIGIAISIVIGLIAVAVLYTENLGDNLNNGNGQNVTPEPKKFIVDLEENVGLVSP